MNLRRFVERYWESVYPGVDLKPSQPLDAMCNHLQAITDGLIKNLVISAPPGSGMTSMTTVFWPAWEWYDRGLGKHAFASVSYREPLAVSSNALLGPLVKKMQRATTNHSRSVVDNGLGGSKFAYGLYSAVCGNRFERLVLDTPNDPNSTPEMLDRDWDIFYNHWMCRLRPGGALVVGQRLIRNGDIAGRLPSSRPDEFVHLLIEHT